jgi:hypothetical protein
MLISKNALSNDIAEITGLNKDAARAALDYIVGRLFVQDIINQAAILNEAVVELRRNATESGFNKRANPFTQKKLGDALKGGGGASNPTNAMSMILYHRSKDDGGYIFPADVWRNIKAGNLDKFNDGVPKQMQIDLKHSFVVFVD